METTSNVEINEDLSDKEKKGIKQLFNLFNINDSGRINPKDFTNLMKSLGYNSNNSEIYKIFEDLDKKNAKKNEKSKKKNEIEGISFDELVDEINYKLGDKKSKKGIKKFFDIFNGKPNSDKINFDILKNISEELGENLSDEDLKDILFNDSENGNEITFEEFYNIMTTNSFS